MEHPGWLKQNKKMRPEPFNTYQICLLIVCIVLLTLSCQRFLTSNVDALALSVHDDSFYYLLPAFNCSRLGFFTFDGIHPTYGFQPLYALVLAALSYCVGSLESLLRWSLILNAVLFAATGCVLVSSIRIALEHRPNWIRESAALFGALFFLLNVPVFMASITAKENALACFLLALLVDLYLRIEKQKDQSAFRLPFTLGVIAGCLVLTRLLPSSVFMLMVLFSFLYGQKKLVLYPLIGAMLPLMLWGAYAYHKFAHVLPTSSSIKSGVFTVFSQLPEASSVSSPLLVPFEYLYQTGRFSLGFSSVFHYTLHPNGWIVDGAPTNYGVHSVLVLIGLISLIYMAATWKRLQHCDLLITSLLFASAVGLFITPFLMKVKDLYYFTWYIFDQPYLISFMFAIAFAKALQLISTIELRIPTWRPQWLNNSLSTILSVIIFVVALSTYYRYQPVYQVEVNQNLWSHLILASSSYVDQHLKISAYSKIGSFNAGALGFFLPERVINLDGLANDDVYLFTQNGGSIGEYIHENAIDYCIDFNIEEVLEVEGVSFKPLRSFPLNEGRFSIVQIHSSDTFQAHDFSLRIDDALYEGAASLGLFEHGSDNWNFEGSAMSGQPAQLELGLFPAVTGYVGNGLVHSGLNEDGGAMTGEAVSPVFTVRENQYLIFSVGGSQSQSVGAHLKDGGSVLGEWRGSGASHLDEIQVDVSEYKGRQLHLTVFDYDDSPGEYILFDHAMILSPSLD